MAVYRVACESLERVRQGGAPVLVEGKPYRLFSKTKRRVAKSAALSPAVAKEAAAAGVKPAALLTRVGPHEKPLPKPSTGWTHSFLGCRARKSKCPGNQNPASEPVGALPGSTERPYRSERNVRARVVALYDLRS